MENGKSNVRRVMEDIDETELDEISEHAISTHKKVFKRLSEI